MTERERAHLIRDYAEITIRPNFDADCIITKTTWPTSSIRTT
jgi:hypothetical protein